MVHRTKIGFMKFEYDNNVNVVRSKKDIKSKDTLKKKISDGKWRESYNISLG